MPAVRLGIAVALCFALVGCGGGAHSGSPSQATIATDTESSSHATIAEGSKTAACSGAMGGSGDSHWRSEASVAGRFGVFGTGRDFRTADQQGLAGFSGLQERHVHGPILVTKTPFVVEGSSPVTVTISERDQPRAGMVAGIPFGGGPYAEIRLVPCRDQPRTWWPAGFVLRDQNPVAVLIRPDNEPQTRLVVGRP